MEKPFQFDTTLLASCASFTKDSSSGIVKARPFDGSNSVIDSHDEDYTRRRRRRRRRRSCYNLFQSYGSYYGREVPPSLALARQDPQLMQRFERFIDSVHFVYRHNAKVKQGHDGDVANAPFARYYVTLNQFADTGEYQSKEGTGSARFPREWHIQDDDKGGGDALGKKFDGHSLHYLNDSSSIFKAASLNFPHHVHSHHHHHKHKHHEKKKKKKTHNLYHVLRLPDNQTEPFAQMQLSSSMEGNEVEIKKSKHYKENGGDPEVPVDPFAQSLNWATENNPDAVELVHHPFNQGRCGSCWAFAATGTLEASVARSEASKAYKEFMTDSLTNESLIYQPTDDTWNNSADEPHQSLLRMEHQQEETTEANAVAFARTVERNVFQRTNLSVQELIDCDKDDDQGCTGGNPILAFPYIHSYGLTSSTDYQYTSNIRSEGGCLLDNYVVEGAPIPKKVATVQSWGILAANKEFLIELVLRYIGPVAVSINAGDPSFLAYGGGIYDNWNCDNTVANHALLIVGYGTEIEEGQPLPETEGYEGNATQRLIRYWIARNSWGTAWGENGFIRIKRAEEESGNPGICGVARTPSVALGGMFLLDTSNQTGVLEDQDVGTVWKTGVNNEDGNVHCRQAFDCYCGRAMRRPFLTRSCLFFTRYFAEHRAFSLAIFGIVCSAVIAVWPLSLACRRRRKRMKRPSSAGRNRLSKGPNHIQAISNDLSPFDGLQPVSVDTNEMETKFQTQHPSAHCSDVRAQVDELSGLLSAEKRGYSSVHV